MRAAVRRSARALLFVLALGCRRQASDLAQALFRAGKHFDMLPLAGFTHMVPDPVVKRALAHRVYEFFRIHLGEPDARR